MVLDVAGLFEIHTLSDEVRMQDTRSPDAGLYVNVDRLVAILAPFTFHKYDGFGPPFVGVAVKVTGVPAHMLFMEAEMLTFTESPGFTVTGKFTGFPIQFPTFGVM